MEEIKCEFKETGIFEPSFIYKDEKKKFGRYEGGAINIKGCGIKIWSVAASIITPNPPKSYLKGGATERAVVEACLAHLNKPPTKRSKKLKYGTLECRHYIFHEDFISVSLMVDEKNNKNFWGRGSTKCGNPLAKRGRPRKKK